VNKYENIEKNLKGGVFQSLEKKIFKIRDYLLEPLEGEKGGREQGYHATDKEKRWCEIEHGQKRGGKAWGRGKARTTKFRCCRLLQGQCNHRNNF